jgi:hypothetical protein
MVDIDIKIVSIVPGDPLVANPSREGRAAIRLLVFWRDHFNCVYCGKSRMTDGAQLHLDHVVPVSHGGTFTFDNLVTACAMCNWGKRDAIFDEKTLALIRTLIRQNNERFRELADKSTRERIGVLQWEEVTINPYWKIVTIEFNGERYNVTAPQQDAYVLRKLDGNNQPIDDSDAAVWISEGATAGIYYRLRGLLAVYGINVENAVSQIPRRRADEDLEELPLCSPVDENLKELPLYRRVKELPL